MSEGSKSHIFPGTPDDLKNERRKKILPVEPFVERVLSNLKFKNVAVDYGAGIGYFTIPIAKSFKKVYATEIREDMIAKLKEELESHGIKNVEILHTEKPPEIKESIDFVLFSNVLHEVDNYRELISWAKNSKVICIIEWKKIETEFGPPVEHRLEKEDVEKVLKEYFEFFKELDIYPYHYTLIGYKKKEFWL